MQTHFRNHYSQIYLFAVMESCDSRKRNVLLQLKSVQEFAITFGENVLRCSNGWQYKLLKHRELCSEVLAEPAGHGSCAVPVPAAPSPAARQDATRGCGNSAARCLPLERHPGGQAGKEM